MMNDLNSSVADRLLQDEEYARIPYIDSQGKLTGAIGRNLTDVGISPQEARYMLNNDIAASVASANKVISNFNSLTFNQRIVVVCMIFNLGLPRFLTFKKMIAAILAGDNVEVAQQMLQSEWHDQVGDRAVRLANLWTEG
jgi:lysozyme